MDHASGFRARIYINDAKIVVTEPRGVPTVEFAAATVARPHIRPATGVPSF